MKTVSSPMLRPAPIAGPASTFLVRQILLACGLAAIALYVATNVIVPLQYPGYNVASQVVSELSAIDSPTQGLWVALCLPYGLLMIAFGCGVMLTAGRRLPLRVVGTIIVLESVIGFFWPPMHMREALAAGGATISDTLHIVFTAIWGVLGLTTMAIAALALGRSFRLFTLASVAVMLIAGVWTGLDAPRLQANLPTPWIGIAERVNMGAYFLWLTVLAIVLVRRAADPDKN